LLFWDRIAIADLERMLDTDVRVRRAWPNAPEDVEWLRDQGIIFHVPVRLRSELLADPGYRAALEAAGTATEEYKSHADGPNLGSHLLAMQLGMISRSYVCRALAADIRLTQHLDAVSLLAVPQENFNSHADRDHVLRIVVDALPLPDATTALADLLAFKNEHAHQLRGLRVWASEVGRGSLSGREAEDKLQYVLAEYDQQLRLHRLAKSRGRVVVVVTTLAEIAENLVRLKFGTVAKIVTSLRHENATLLLDEHQLSGRDVSYVVEARDAFGDDPSGA
jgi:hypothetical protein